LNRSKSNNKILRICLQSIKKKKNKITLKSERDNDFNDLAASSGGNYDFDNFDEDFI
jgi:hypothetical protein